MGLLDFFNSESSKQHKLILGDDLNKKGINYIAWSQTSTAWRTLVEKNNTFVKESYSKANVDKLSLKEFENKLVEYAKRGILVQKEQYNLQLKLLQNQYRSQISSHNELSSAHTRVKSVPFYNWLEEKE